MPGPMSRKCQHCGRVFEAQRQEHDGSTFRAMDSRGRMQLRRTATVDAMPAYLMRAIHERDCEAKAR